MTALKKYYCNNFIKLSCNVFSVYYINYNVIKYALRWMPRKDSDQPVHPHSLISLHWALLDSKDPSLFFFVFFFLVHSELDSRQTAKMTRLTRLSFLGAHLYV